MKFISFDEDLARRLKDPAFKREYDALEPEYAVIRAVIGKRIEKKMSQQQLARKVGTKQSAISRLESGNANPRHSVLGCLFRLFEI
jgi:predicted transcriptional regulator